MNVSIDIFAVQTNTKNKLMNRKINMFTLMIFAYSVIICATFKKGDVQNPLSTAKATIQPTIQKTYPAGMNAEKITASVAPVANVSQ
jgi:hypothetical protein